MTKQEILDKNPETNQEFAVQMILTQMTKTEIANTRRAMQRIYTAVYKSWARSMPYNEMFECVQRAEKFATQGNDNDNDENVSHETMESDKAIRRRRNG